MVKGEKDMILPMPEEILDDNLYEFDKETNTFRLKKDVPERIRKIHDDYWKQRDDFEKKHGFKPKIKKRGNNG